MSRKTPIWDDVVTGIGGKFTDSRDTLRLAYNFAILQENHLPILQEDGARKYLYQENDV